MYEGRGWGIEGVLSLMGRGRGDHLFDLSGPLFYYLSVNLP